MLRAARVDRGDGKYLGALCRRGHDAGAGCSLRYVSGGHCIACFKQKDAKRRPPQGRSRTPEEVLLARRSAERRQWRREKPDEARRKGRENYANNRLMIRLRNRLRKAFNMFSKNGKEAPSTEYVDFMAVIRHLGPCPGDPAEWEIDHIRPLCAFDFNDQEQVRQAFAPANHQWLPASENRRKHAKGR